MKNLKYLLVSLLVMPLAIAAPKVLKVAEVNQAIDELLQPLRNEKTIVNLSFDELKLSEKYTESVKITAEAVKVGTYNILRFDLPELSYKRNAGRPVVRGEAKLNLNFVKAFGQKMINDLGPSAHEIVADFVKEYSKDYGQAVKLDAKVTQEVYDANKNLTGLVVRLKASVDMTKLPASMPEREVPLTKLDVVFTATPNRLYIKGMAIMNPTYRGYDKDEQGMKEYLEKILAKDAATLKDISSLAEIVNTFAGYAVEKDSSKDQ